MEENLETKVSDVAPDNTGSPTSEEWEAQQESSEEIKDLTDDELKSEIQKFQEEAKTEEDPKAKRHLQQLAGLRMKEEKDRERLRTLEENNRIAEERLQTYEKTLINEVHNKVQDENYWLTYFEDLYNSNPELADKYSKEYWNMNAKNLIIETKRQFANEWNEDYKKVVDEVDLETQIEEKVTHRVALKQVEKMFGSLSWDEQQKAKEYFDDIVEWKKLTIEKAEKYAEMSIAYVTRNNPKQEEPTKQTNTEKQVWDFANTGISFGSNNKTEWNINPDSYAEYLINMWVDREKAYRMAKLQF